MPRHPYGTGRSARRRVGPLAWWGGVLLALGLLPWTLAGQPGPEVPPPAPGDELVERTVQVGGRSVRALCAPGPVEVVLLHDAGVRPEAWRPVLRRLDGQVGACAWERGGSPGAGEPRGWFELLDDLAEAARALDAREPVWVGHGAGGLYARLVALDRRAEVGGLVLLEPVTEGVLEDARRGVPAEVWEARRRERAAPNADGVRVAQLLERARGRRLPDLPVTVVTATEREEGEGWVPRWIQEAARRHHGALASGLRLGRHVPAPGSGPDLPAEAAELVAEEILRAVRLRGR